MKGFLRFLFFLLLLLAAVIAVQTWSDRRQGVRGPLEQWFGDVLDGRPLRGKPEKYTVATGPRIDLKDVDVLAAMSRQRVVLARAVVPSVVSITTSRTVQAPGGENDLFPFFHHGLKRGPATQRQLGSGAIVSKEGHIVTNNHVIDGMEEIEVELSDGRRKKARLVGTDPDTDIAVLKIDAGDVQPMPLGDSDAVEVGETVMAVGNPYGFEESVTQGIISAKGRHGSENTSDLLQTDTAINPGNSGGPLINVRGELIGINEAIVSETGSAMGVGFAIPSATVRRTMDGILRQGRVIHGYLGINRALSTGPGVMVDTVVTGSPADKAAIQPGDVIRKFNGRTIEDFDDLRRGVAAVEVDTTVPVEILRDGRAMSVQARITEKPPQDQLSHLPHNPRGQGPVPGNGKNTGDAGLLGAVQTRELTPGDLRKLDLPDSTRGVVVTGIGEKSPAVDRLREGDIIEQVNQQPVGSAADYAKCVRGLTEGEPILLSVVRDRGRVLVVVNPG